MAKKQFKAESKRLLDLMIHSIYTHHEIFLRELISNASDALDKLYYRSLSDGETGTDRSEYVITLKPDKEARTLTVSDNGIGMTKEELEDNLGIIAKSGSLSFKQALENGDDADIIGQFGVGFYAAFMVSDKVTVTSRAYQSEEAYVWESEGVDGYTVNPAQKETRGTDIVLHIKPDSEEESFSEFLQEYRIKSLVKKYSDYIRYPIRMDMPQSRLKEGAKGDKAEDYEEYTETETLNSMVPLWRKNKNEVTAQEYQDFYKDKFHDSQDALRVIHSSAEGAATYQALLFIPAQPPYDYYTRTFEKGLQLYSSGVLIMEKCADLLPDCFSFVRGLVDSADLSLNISREMLQHDRQLKVIAGRLEKKIASELAVMLREDREHYEAFFSSFGLQLKFGVYNDFGQKKDLLQDLLLFDTSAGEKPVTLAEYADRMKEGQKDIYYACGDDRALLDSLPQAEAVREKGFEILYLHEDVDEFCLKTLHTYRDHEFKNVSDGDLDLSTDEEKKQAKEKADENKSLLDEMKSALPQEVTAVRLSSRLKTHPVCLTSEGGLTLEMEKVLSRMPGEQPPKAERVLEINESHPIWQTLQALYASDREKLKEYAKLLYTQALLIEGLPAQDPVAFSEAVCRLMIDRGEA